MGERTIVHGPARRVGRRSGLSGWTVVAAAIGNALEWYDWVAYPVFAVYFSEQFFPGNGNPLLAALAVFAMGFLFRPLGGILLASYADRHGRKPALTLSAGLMAAGSLMIGICPTYHQWGVLAPIVLVIARVLQGLATGGEFAAAATYLAEVAPPGERGLYSSFTYVTGTVGVVFATLTKIVLLQVIGKVGLEVWGWRLPFLFGAIVGVWAFAMRNSLGETKLFVPSEDRRVRRPVLQVLREHPASGLRVVGFTVGATPAYYLVVFYLPEYVIKQFHADELTALRIAAVVQLALVAVLPFLGALSDRVGRKPLLATFAIGYLVLAVPMAALLDGSPWALLVVMGVGVLFFACYAAVAPIAMAELFPPQMRSTGLGMPYSVAVAVFGGPAPMLLQALNGQGLVWVVPWVLCALCGVSLVVYLTSPETVNKPIGGPVTVVSPPPG